MGKYVKVMYGTTSDAKSDFKYKINMVIYHLDFFKLSSYN